MAPSRRMYVQGEDFVQSDPNTHHVNAAMEALECVIVQDLFLNETAKFAHVFLPGSSFLEKDGTFTNAERRVSRVRKVMEPLAGYQDWEITVLLSNALGYPMNYTHPSADHGRDRAAHADLRGAHLREDRPARQHPVAVQRREAPEGTPTMHVHQFVRGKGKFWPTEYVPTSERSTSRFPLILTTGRILSQYNVGAQTRRTNNVVWHAEDVLEIHPHDAEVRGITDGDWVGLTSRAGETVLRAKVTREDRTGRGLHHVPLPGDQRQRRHDRELRLGDQLPGVQGHGGRGGAGEPEGCLAEARGSRARAAAPGTQAPPGSHPGLTRQRKRET